MKVLTLLLFITLLPTFAFAKNEGEKKKKFWRLDQGQKCKGKRKYPSEAGPGYYASKSKCAAKLTCNAGYYKNGHKCKKEKKWVLYNNKSCKKKWTKDYQGQSQYDSKSACKSAELGDKVYYADSEGKCKKAYSKNLPQGVTLEQTFSKKRDCRKQNRVYVVNSKGRCKKASRTELESQGKVEGKDFFKDKSKCKSDGRGDKVYYADSEGKCKKAYSKNLPQGVTLEQTFSKKRDCRNRIVVYVLENGTCKETYSSKGVGYDNTSSFETKAACQTKAGDYTQQLVADGHQVDAPVDTGVDASGRNLSSAGGAIQGAAGGAFDNASAVLGAAPDVGAITGAVPGGASVADASTIKLQSKLAQQKAELDNAISPEQRACEAEGNSWDPTARRGNGKCRKSEKRTASRVNRKIKKCDKVIARGVRRALSNKKRWNSFNLKEYLNRKRCSPSHLEQYALAIREENKMSQENSAQ